MGYSMSLYRVDLDAMRDRIARKDQALLEDLRAKHAEDIANQQAEIDEEEHDFDAPEAPSGCMGFVGRLLGAKTPAPPTHPQPSEKPTAELLLRQLVFGEPKFHGGFSLYGYQFQWLVSYLGTPLDADAFESMRSSSGWTKKVGEALVSAGLPKSVFEFEKMLTERGAPVPMPAMMDFPFIGYMEASEVKAAQAAMQNVDLAKVAEATGEAEYGAMAAENVKSWFDEAAAANQGIVAFYY